MPRTIKLSLISLIFLSIFTFAQSDIVNKIEINGNVRIPDSTIKMFSQIDIGKDINSEHINQSLKKLYETNFFDDVSIKLESNILTVTVVENPIIENISYNGIKSNSLKEKITENLNLTSRSSFNKILLQNDKNSILSSLKNNGYYFSTIDVGVSELDKNKVDLIFNINLGNKAKIKKISFIGDKKYKDKQLRNVIVSEEYKFWKFISGKKYLNESLIQFDKRLLKNFYLNKGYYDISVNSTFAKLLKDDEFELVFNIDSKNKFFFGDLTIELPVDFDSNNFKDLKNFFIKLKGKPYSLNSVQKIINKID